MSQETVFLIEKSMGLFWVLVQQVCFCGVGYVYGDLARGSAFPVRRFLLRQAAVFAVLCALCFERELGIPFLSSMLIIDGRDFYPWAVRITLCSMMILFDALLLVYTWRVYGIYTRGRQTVRPTWRGDLCVVIGVGLLCVLWIHRSIATTLLHNLSMWDYTWMGRAFIQLSNFFYVPLEIAGAILLYFFRKAVRRSLAATETTEAPNV